MMRKKHFNVIIYLFLCLSAAADGRKQDIVAVLDVSATSHEVELSKTLLLETLDRMSVSPSTTRIALFLLNDDIRPLFNFKSYVNRECIFQAIRKVKHHAGVEPSQHSWVVAKNTVQSFLHKNRRREAISVALIFLRKELMKQSTTIHAHRQYNFWLGADSKDKLKNNRLHSFYLSYVNDVYKALDHLPWKKSYVECQGNGPVRDECHRVCQCISGRKTNCHRERKELSRLSNTERRRLFKAYYTISTDPHYKTAHDMFVKIHFTYTCSKIHNEDYFNPWHRWYLVILENTLRQFDCRITLPYWDWSYWKDKGQLWSHKIWRETNDDLGGNGLPSHSCCVHTGIFRKDSWSVPGHENISKVISTTDSLSESNGHHSQTFERYRHAKCLRRFFNNADVQGAGVVNRLIGVPLDRFRDAMIFLRYNVHNAVHMAVGGTMASAFSADTPEFWFHHAMMDKIWYLWQQRGHAFKYAYYEGMNETMFLWPYSQSEIIDSSNLPKCIKVKYDNWPSHKPIHYNIRRFHGNHTEKDVCSDESGFNDYTMRLISDFNKLLRKTKSRQRKKRTKKNHAKSRVGIFIDWLKRHRPYIFRKFSFRQHSSKVWNFLWQKRGSQDLFLILKHYDLVT